MIRQPTECKIIFTKSVSGKGLTTRIYKELGVAVVAQWLTNPTRKHEVAGLVPALAKWVNDLALP